MILEFFYSIRKVSASVCTSIRVLLATDNDYDEVHGNSGSVDVQALGWTSLITCHMSLLKTVSVSLFGT